MLDFSLSDEQKALIDAARRFSRERIAPVAAECDREARFPKDVFVAAHELGLVNATVEPEFGGPGLHDGQYLLVNKAVYFKINLHTLGKYIPFIDEGDDPERFIFHGPHRGDVIVFRYPRDTSRDFIKRVIGVPGLALAIVNGIIGAGIFVLPGIVGAKIGAFGVFAYIFCSIMMLAFMS